MGNDALEARMRQLLLRALGNDRPAVTPTEQRIWNFRQRWEQSHNPADYRAYKSLAPACPHAQTVAYRQTAMNGALAVYLRCLSCDQNVIGAGIAIPHQVVRGCGVDPWALPEHAEHPAPIFDVCAHCGQRKPGEWHHFAPRARFSEPDEWPAAYLCIDCHSLWHDVMGHGNEPWVRTEAQVRQERKGQP